MVLFHSYLKIVIYIDQSCASVVSVSRPISKPGGCIFSLCQEFCSDTNQPGSKEEMVKMKMRTIKRGRSRPANLFPQSLCCIASIFSYLAIGFTSDDV